MVEIVPLGGEPAEAILRLAAAVKHHCSRLLSALYNFNPNSPMLAPLKALLFVEQHPATMARDYCYNEPLRDSASSELPSTVFAQAAVWGASQGLARVVRCYSMSKAQSLPPFR